MAPIVSLTPPPPAESVLPPPEVWGFNAEKFPEWRVGQDAAVMRIVDSDKRVSVACLPTGCLSGDTMIGANRGGNHRKYTLRKLHNSFNGGASIRQYRKREYYWDLSIPTRLGSLAEGTFVLNDVKAIYASGIKTTFTLTTDSGRSIRASAEHPFLTLAGWQKLSELSVGDLIYVDGGQKSGRKPKKKTWYNIVNYLKFHPMAARKGVREDKGGWSVVKHHLVVEAELNGMEYGAYVALLRSGPDEAVADLQFINPATHAVHHEDEDAQNNQRENLLYLTHVEHQRLHAKKDAWRHVVYKPALEAVTSIVEYGEEETFDIEMAAEPHNFLANGFVVHNSGKTLFAMASAKLMDARTVFLTRRKGLQSQMARDFDDPPVHDVRGQSSYVCNYSPSVTVDVGPCHAGFNCRYRRGGCGYYDAVKVAKDPDTQAVVTNYSFWFMQAKRRNKQAVIDAAEEGEEGDTALGEVGLLVCDEAHGVLDELSNFLTVELVRADIERLGIAWPADAGNDVDSWKRWAAVTARPRVARLLDEAKARAKDGGTAAPAAEVRERRRLDALLEKLGDLAGAAGEWACQLSERAGSMRACPVWPGEYLEKYLFQGAAKVLMMSATIRPKTLELLGLTPDDYDYFETQSTFPTERRLVWSVDAPRLSHRSEPGELGIWLDRIDYILSKRLDRRVIIHVGSYDRKNFIMTRSKYRQYMMGHDRGDVDVAIARFKRSRPPVILVSQSITEGFDFPYDDCRAQIIAKWPFPDSRDPLVKARQTVDADYGAYVSVQALVQATGRAMRAHDDLCETFIVDGQAKWALWKYQEFAPAWFMAAVKQVKVAPEPPDLVVAASLAPRLISLR